jgi:hypothetical protein
MTPLRKLRSSCDRLKDFILLLLRSCYLSQILVIGVSGLSTSSRESIFENTISLLSLSMYNFALPKLHTPQIVCQKVQMYAHCSIRVRVESGKDESMLSRLV